MIPKVSFTGQVFQAGNVKNSSKPNEINQIKKYSDRSKCDVVLMDRNYYVDGTGVYDALLIKKDNSSVAGRNMFARREFDFRDDPNIDMPVQYFFYDRVEDVFKH